MKRVLIVVVSLVAIFLTGPVVSRAQAGSLVGLSNNVAFDGLGMGYSTNLSYDGAYNLYANYQVRDGSVEYASTSVTGDTSQWQVSMSFSGLLEGTRVNPANGNQSFTFQGRDLSFYLNAGISDYIVGGGKDNGEVFPTENWSSGCGGMGLPIGFIPTYASSMYDEWPSGEDWRFNYSVVWSVMAPNSSTSVGFSTSVGTEPIPEPATLAVSALGFGFLVQRRRRR